MPSYEQLREQWSGLVKSDPASLRAAYMSAKRLEALAIAYPESFGFAASKPGNNTHLSLKSFTAGGISEDAAIELQVEAPLSGGVRISLGTESRVWAAWPKDAELVFDVPDFGKFILLADSLPPEGLNVRPMATTTTTTTAAPTSTTTTTTAIPTTTTAAPVKDQGFYLYTVSVDDYEFMSGDEVQLVNVENGNIIVDYRSVSAADVLARKTSFTLQRSPETAPMTVQANVRRAGNVTPSEPVRVPAAGAVPGAPWVGQAAPVIADVPVPPISSEVDMEPAPEPGLVVGTPTWNSTLPAPTTTTTSTTTTTAAPTTTEAPPEPLVDRVFIQDGRALALTESQNVIEVIEGLMGVDDVAAIAHVFLGLTYPHGFYALKAYTDDARANMDDDKAVVSFRTVDGSPWEMTESTEVTKNSIKISSEKPPADFKEFIMAGDVAIAMAAAAAYSREERFVALGASAIKDTLVRAEVRRIAADSYRLGLEVSMANEPLSERAKRIGTIDGMIAINSVIVEWARRAFVRLGRERDFADILNNQIPAAMIEVLIELGKPGDLSAASLFKDSPEHISLVQKRVHTTRDFSQASARRQAFGANNRSMYDQAAYEDLQRHYQTTTNPDTRKAMEQQHLPAAEQKAKESAAAAQEKNQKVQGDAPKPESPTNPNTNFWVKLGAALLKPSGLPAPAIVRAERGAVDTFDNFVSVDRGSEVLNRSITSFFETNRADAAQNITNLFDVDFNDFRRLGIMQPLYAMQTAEGAGTNNRANLASIFVVPDSLGKGGQAEEFEPFHGSGPAKEYNSFILTGVRASYAEKAQIDETLGDGVVGFFYGKKAEVWSISGVLLNDLYNDQLYRFQEFYENVLRGSKLVERGKKAAFSVPSAGMMFRGYPIGLDLPIDASSEEMVQFTLQIWVTDVNLAPLINIVSDTTKSFVGALNVLDGASVKAGSYAENVRNYLRSAKGGVSRTDEAALIGPNNGAERDLGMTNSPLIDRNLSPNTSYPARIEPARNGVRRQAPPGSPGMPAGPNGPDRVGPNNRPNKRSN